jgi:tetratricopeptide (TPR) repeat protein
MLRNLILAALATTMCALPASSRAQANPALPTAPTQPALKLDYSRMHAAPPDYEAAPPAIREFLLKSKEVDAIPDPLQRCLAYPALPDTQWPENLAAQHCQLVFGLKLGFKDIKARIDHGDVAGLDATFKALLDRHFSKTDFSEHIHKAFDLIGTDEESARVSKRWLELAPDSAYAMTARAEYLRLMGWKARGGELASETSEQQMAQMVSFHEQAAALFRKALETEPRMMPAYVGLVDIGRSGAMEADDAFEQGRMIDPACEALVAAQMVHLQPRWGGSWEEMQALETQLLPFLAERPLLALPLSYRAHDMADTYRRAKEPEQALAAVQPAIATTTNPSVLEDLAYSMGDLHSHDVWPMLADLVAASRFRTDSSACECKAKTIAAAAEFRGSLQQSAPHDLEASNRSYAVAVKAQPGDAEAHFFYAQSFERLFKPDEAEREYLLMEKVSKVVEERAAAVNYLALMMIKWKKSHKALAYARRLVKDYPSYPKGWLTLARALATSGKPSAKAREALETYLRKVDRNDRASAVDIQVAEQALRDLK